MSFWRKKKVLITGGAGFLGSSLAQKLVKDQAQVTIIDNMMPGFGGNLHNLDGILDYVKINFADIRDRHALNYIVKDQEYVFHAAQLNDHVHALTDPFPDLDVNIVGTTTLMEAIKHSQQKPRLFYLGTRSEYGPVGQLPVKEDTPTNPRGIYEISTLTAQRILNFYHSNHQIPATIFRITNVYGPRGQMRHNRTGVANWFIRKLIDQEPIPIMGTGNIKRDFVYVDDVVSAVLRAAEDEKTVGELYNIGIDQPTTFLELAQAMIQAYGKGSIQYIPMSPERAASEPGDYYSDISKIHAAIGWKPTTSLMDGLKRTFDYYTQHREQYWK